MRTILFVFCLFIIGMAKAQNDSLSLNFEEGKSKMLKENLFLLAEHYNLDLKEAEIEQASLWENPLFVWNAEMYSIAQHRYFNFGNQKLIQLEYEFSVSGKRVNAIKEAKISKEIASLAFSDVIRALVYDYSEKFYQLLSLRETNAILENVYAEFENLIKLNQKKLELGAASEVDVTRLRAEHLALLSEINGNKNDISRVHADLSMLLNIDPKVKIYPQRITQFSAGIIDVQQLIDTAKVYRPDYLMAMRNIDFYQASLKKQRSEAIPNINLGYQPLDQGSNHVRPYAGMVFEMSIPIFNRNQGNISAAKVQIEQSKLQVDYKLRGIESEIYTSFMQFQNAKSLYDSYGQELLDKMAELYANAKINYQKRNISLIEYIDYQRSYIENQKNYIDVINTYRQNLNQLNFVVGKNLNN